MWGGQAARDRQQNPEPKTVTCGELVGTRAQGLLWASVSTTKRNGGWFTAKLTNWFQCAVKLTWYLRNLRDVSRNWGGGGVSVRGAWQRLTSEHRTGTNYKWSMQLRCVRVQWTLAAKAAAGLPAPIALLPPPATWTWPGGLLHRQWKQLAQGMASGWGTENYSSKERLFAYKGN